MHQFFNPVKLLLAVCIITLPCRPFAQPVHKDRGVVNGEKFNFYYLQPEGQIKGLLILLPAAGEKPQSVFKKTRLPQLLAAQGYITLIPEVHTLLYADDYSIAVLDHLLAAATEQYKVSNYIIGGLSSGGAVATRYAEYQMAERKYGNLKGLIVIDAPLDLERIYNSAQRGMNYTCGGIIAQQNRNNKAQLENALGGNPVNRHDQYIKFSAYTDSSKNGGNAQYLKTLPIHLYSEPDLAFVQKTYCADLKPDDLNATDLESMNSFLQRAGNAQCKYIATQGRGFHSWNIIDADECASWIKSINP